MSFNINNQGSVADALNIFKDDIADTLNNISMTTDVLTSALMKCEDDTIQLDTSKFPINIVYNDENISLNYDNGSIHLFNGLAQDLGELMNVNDGTVNQDIIGYNPYDILSSCNGDLASNEILLDACELAINNDYGSVDIASMLGSKYGPQASSLSSKAKESLDSIQTYLQRNDNGPTGVASFISSLYESIANTQVDTDGRYYESSDKPWKISGFVGAYAISTVVRASAVVIGAVITVVQPIIGIAVYLLSSAFNALKDLVLDKTSALVGVNDKVTNNMLDMSLFDYDINYTNMPYDPKLFFQDNPEIKSVSYRMAGCTWIFSAPFTQGGVSKFHLQIMCNVEYTTMHVYDPSTYSNGTLTTLPTSGIIAGKQYSGIDGFFNECLYSTSLYSEVINSSAGVTQSTLDAQARVSVMADYSVLFGLAAAWDLGYGQQVSVSSAYPSSFSLAECTAYANQHKGSASNSWASIVQFRNDLRSYGSIIGVKLCYVFNQFTYYRSTSTDNNPISRRIGFPKCSKFFMTVPNYTGGAVWGSLIAIGAVVTVGIIAAITVHKLKVKIKKFTIRKQLDVEAKRYAYENNPSDASFDAYWNSMRSFNKWTLLTGYDKIDLMTGYMSSDASDKADGGYGLNLIKKVTNREGENVTVDLATLYKLIAG